MQCKPMKWIRTSSAGRANPTRILQAKRRAGLCGELACISTPNINRAKYVLFNLL